MKYTREELAKQETRNRIHYRRLWNDHKCRAKIRNIPFLLTFEEWLKIWEDSKHLHERGSRKGEYCMSRRGDLGPYAVGNVFIQLSSDNISQAQSNKLKTGKTAKGYKQIQVECPYCGKIGGINNMQRLHINKCKHRPTTTAP